MERFLRVREAGKCRRESERSGKQGFESGAGFYDHVARDWVF